MNLRERAATDARVLNTRDWGLPVILIDPSGIRYTTDNVTGEELKAVQVLSDRRKFNPQTGEEMTVTEPIVVMSRASLARVPLPGEIWFMEFTLDPDPDATKDTFILDATRAPEGGRSLGLIRLYPRKVVQDV